MTPSNAELDERVDRDPDLPGPGPVNNQSQLEPDRTREYVFTPEEKSVFDAFSQRMMELNQQASGAAQMIATLRKLEGTGWMIAPDNSKLIRKA